MSRTRSTAEPALHHCRVVLVQPRIAGNLGATARVMRNFGLGDLVLVAPEADPADPNARQQSTHGEDILQGARIVPDLGTAVADCSLVVGTSARTGGLFRKQSMGTPDDIMPRLLDHMTGGNKAALVFGPEPRGLTNDEISRCHYLIHIPAALEYPALNLAQAVAICLYELRRTWLRTERPAEVPNPLAPFADQHHMFAQLRTALEEIHFLYGDKADSLMHALRHLLGRAGLSDMEVDLLRGLARQIRWYVQQRENPPNGRNPD